MQSAVNLFPCEYDKSEETGCDAIMLIWNQKLRGMFPATC